MNTFVILGAYIFDLIFGDPPAIPHPVVLFGKYISFLETIFYKENKSDKSKFVSGLVLVVIVILTVFFLTLGFLKLISFLPPFVQFLIQAWLLSTTIAAKGLDDVASEIKLLLEENNLKKARKQVGYIVGRDTEKLDSKEIVRATVETVAENIVDAITSPLFYAFLGGVPLALTYRAVNTMDSMLGYKNDKYMYFGKAAARVDDIFNFIPARLTGLIIAIVAFILPGYNGKNSLKIIFRDARKHLSPNSGFTEGAVAGALKVRLGGENYYFGEYSFREYIGDEIEPLTPITIKKTVDLMYLSSFVWVLFFTTLNF